MVRILVVLPVPDIFRAVTYCVVGQSSCAASLRRRNQKQSLILPPLLLLGTAENMGKLGIDSPGTRPVQYGPPIEDRIP